MTTKRPTHQSVLSYSLSQAKAPKGKKAAPAPLAGKAKVSTKVVKNPLIEKRSRNFSIGMFRFLVEKCGGEVGWSRSMQANCC